MATDTRQVTDPAAFRHRSLAKQVLFAVLTLGLYTIYWYYITFDQLNRGTDAEYNTVLRFLGLFVPVLNIVILWWFSQDAEAVVDQDGVLVFLAELVFPPVVWYLVQSGINDVATGDAA
ncbi:DUF4234 domain-containing protein [Natronobiforma cellulositropha]|uniref:DUF4234 domain-containing protein n=1 Tax=Natronobiforma cellulositropha TaxID=1679076 RepID=UPI0021D56BF7|nr:DUF4234 domain-containing protein [Natronobiforma cellulositropha]